MRILGNGKGSGNDLLTGSVIKKLILFFLPIAAGTIFQQLYNAVDAFVVSKYVGTNALAAVGGSPAILSNLVIGFFVALTAGFSVVISQQFGSGKFEEVKHSVLTAMVFCGVSGLIIGLLMVIFSTELLTVMKTTPEAFADSLEYQKIYFSGTVLILLFNMGSGVLRAVGDSRYPFICLFVSCALNIALDILFVVVFDMGVSGVAYATLLAEGVSTTMVLLKLFLTKGCHKLCKRGAKFRFAILKRMLVIGVPSGVQSSMYGISNLILQIGVNTLGTLVVASWAMSGKVDGIYWAVTSAFGTAVTTFVGQNYGAKNYARIKECTRKGLITHAALTAGVSIFLMTLGKYILAILTDDRAVIDTTFTIMTYFVPYYVTWCLIEIIPGVLRGIGDTLIPSLIQACGICILRIIWVYTVFASYQTLFSLSMSYLVSWVVTDVGILIYYFLKPRKRLAELERRKKEAPPETPTPQGSEAL